eukprot:INCI12874.2.p1 GENE.INCI12874.2~~INCI12874.2.p1  ORF type:complete len:821 (+),score=217.23 INCI12874.2:271-2733(+)
MPSSHKKSKGHGGGGGGAGVEGRAGRKNRGGLKKPVVPLYQRDIKEIEALNARIVAEAPERGHEASFSKNHLFSELPISGATLEGLTSAKFTSMTKVQRASIPHALAGRDILGAAKTGSGKTIAFLVPLLERLFRERWGHGDGLGALVISPTRELALQIFEVLRAIGHKHLLSAGLVIGGKDFTEEQSRILRMNILVATPGRFLQHLEQTPAFSVDTLQMLVLDEADRILDLGFKQQLDGILNYLPPSGQIQTLLFSATQTKRIKDLARLSLSDPEYVAVHDKAEFVTPPALAQRYIVVDHEQKLNTLWAFLKTHLKHKILVFFATCKQAKFVDGLFRQMRPGVPVMSLHGKIKQMKRLAIFADFAQRKAACMFATDIAARGLDFPNVDWVVQVDCPDDVEGYIHRVGRTARFKADGNALLFLTPHEEEPMAELLKKAKVPITKIFVNQKRSMNILQTVRNLMVEKPELKTTGQKAFTSYIRSIVLQPNKAVFDATKIDADAFAQSFGLAKTPKVRALARLTAKAQGEKGPELTREAAKAARQREIMMSNVDVYAGRQDQASEKEAQKPKKRKKSSNPLNSDSDDDAGNADALLKVKRRYVPGAAETAAAEAAASAKAKQDPKSKKLRQLMREAREKSNDKSRLIFDDAGNQLSSNFEALGAVQDDQIEVRGAKAEAERKAFLAKMAARMQEADVEDRQRDRERVRERRRKRRDKLRGPRPEEEEASPVAVLGGTASGSDEGSSDDSDNDSGSDSDDDAGTVQKGARPKATAVADNDSSDSSDSDSDSSDSSSEDGAQAGRKVPGTVGQREEVVRKLLNL